MTFALAAFPKAKCLGSSSLTWATAPLAAATRTWRSSSSRAARRDDEKAVGCEG